MERLLPGAALTAHARAVRWCLMHGDPVDVVSERAQRLGHGVAVDGQAVARFRAIGMELDCKLISNEAQLGGDHAQMRGMKLDLERMQHLAARAGGPGNRVGCSHLEGRRGGECLHERRDRLAAGMRRGQRRRGRAMHAHDGDLGRAALRRLSLGKQARLVLASVVADGFHKGAFRAFHSRQRLRSIRRRAPFSSLGRCRLKQGPSGGGPLGGFDCGAEGADGGSTGHLA